MKKLVLSLLLIPTLLSAAHVAVENESGEVSFFECDLQGVGDLLQAVDHEELGVWIQLPAAEPVSFWNKKAERRNGGPLGYPRDYPGGVSNNEFTDIHFIVTTLADKSIVTIAKKRYNLEAAGDRIDHVHPLNFLLSIFMDEELKVAIRNIRGKGWVWSNFLGGLKETLATEAAINNVMPHVQDFAAKLEINVQLILPAIRSQNWDLLVDQLIKYVPRKGDGGRYDC